MQGGQPARCVSISRQAPGGSSRLRYSDSSEKTSLHFPVRSCNSISFSSRVTEQKPAIGPQVFIQVLTDCQTGAMQARDDVLRQLENLCGLECGQLLHIPQQDDGPVVFRQI